METILKTDNAYEAIDKINANFSDIPDVSTQVIGQGEFTGQGDTFARKEFENTAPGDFLRIEFPNGDWAGAGSNKLAIGYYDQERVNEAFFTIPTGSTIQSGYDIYISPGLAKVFKGLYVSIRATSGTVVPFVLKKIDALEIKPYFKEEMADTITKVKARQGSLCFTFAVCSDLHYRANDSASRVAPFCGIETAANIGELSRHIQLDNIVCLGDCMDGKWQTSRSAMDVDDIFWGFLSTRVPILFALGNHDTNYEYSEGGGDRRFTVAEMFSMYVQSCDPRIVVGNTDGGFNYYRDDDRLKLRLIVLKSVNNAGGYQYTSTTATWFSSVLSNMPSGYKAIVFAHVPFTATHSWGGEPANGGAAITTAIQNNASNIIAFFEGHVHCDDLFAFPCASVLLGCGKAYNPSHESSAWPEDSQLFTRTGGTASEDLWDTVVVNQSEQLMSLIRFGAGVDRYVHYVPVEVSAGGNTTLTPSIVTASSWSTRDSESSSISVSSGTVSVASGATVGALLTVRAVDADGNFEFWVIKVS